VNPLFRDDDFFGLVQFSLGIANRSALRGADRIFFADAIQSDAVRQAMSGLACRAIRQASSANGPARDMQDQTPQEKKKKEVSRD
jgi:hypothetical protein